MTKITQYLVKYMLHKKHPPVNKHFIQSTEEAFCIGAKSLRQTDDTGKKSIYKKERTKIKM